MHVPPPGTEPASVSRLQRLQVVADCIPALVAYVTADERYVAANNAYREWFGLEPDDLIGRTVREMLGEDIYGAIQPYIRRALAGERVTYDITLRFRPGVRDVEVTYVPDIGPGGSVLGFVALVHDISDRKRLEAELHDASRLKDEFLAVVSHELRTPLNAIRGWAALLRTAHLDERQTTHALDVIDRNITAQTQLIEDLLDISRIVSGKMRLDAQPVNLSVAVQAAIDSVRPAAAAKEIRLQRGLDAVDGAVWGDPDRLQQVAWNLLSNAIKFTPTGGRVQVRLRRIDAHLELSVADTGQGIDHEFLPHVFDRFRQADGTTTRPVGGLGLGLAIVRHLVELHGGSVSAESPGEHQGATFIVRLPVIAGHHPEVMPADSRPNLVVDTRLDGVRVLCVDDDPESCDTLAAVLTGVGAEVRSAATVPEGLGTATSWRPDVVVSDIEIAHESGDGFAHRLRALEAATGTRTIVIALMAGARTEDRVRALSAGFHSHLPKPVEPAELVALLGSLLGRGTTAT